jgi:hypothetical protein
MKLTISQIFGISILIAATIFFFAMGMITASKATIEIADLQILTAKVKEIGLIEIKKGRYGATHPSLFIRLMDTPTLFGITHQEKDDYRIYLDEIKVDDEIRILYDPNASLSNDNINFAVYQLDKADKILMPIEDVRKKEITITIVLYAFTVFMALLTVYVYISINKKNKQAAS